MVKAKIKEDQLIIFLEIEEPRFSSTGRTKLIATTRGPRETTAQINGKAVSVICSAFVYPDPSEIPPEKLARPKKHQKRWSNWTQLIDVEEIPPLPAKTGKRQH